MDKLPFGHWLVEGLIACVLALQGTAITLDRLPSLDLRQVALIDMMWRAGVALIVFTSVCMAQKALNSF